MSRIFVLLSTKMVEALAGPTYCRQKIRQNQVMHLYSIYQHLRHNRLFYDTFLLERMFHSSNVNRKVDPDDVSTRN
jgi:hypothetical protein